MPDVSVSRALRTAYAATCAGTALWIFMIFLAPWLAARGAVGAARVVYAVFAPVCHQTADRCFVIQGHPLAVCGRCLGVYAGFAAGLALLPLVRGFSRRDPPPAWMFLLSLLPLAVDGTAGVLGLWKSPLGLRSATGFLWGTVLPFYFLAGLADLVLARRRRRAERDLEKGRGPQ